MQSEDLQAIYALRRQIDLRRQARHQASLAELDAALRSLVPPRAQPYQLVDTDYKALESTHSYKTVCSGAPGTIQSDFCYRVTTLWKLQRFTLNIQARRIDLTQDHPDVSLRIIQQQHKRTPTWLLLRDFIGGAHSGPRGISWWTELSLPGKDLVCSCHRMGLPNEWIPPDALILRCPSPHIHDHSLAFVPSVIDAYFMYIFEPALDSARPKSGITIDLEDPKHLKPGVREWVMPAIDIDESGIELWPVSQTTASTHIVSEDDLGPPLQDYYRAL